MMKSGVDGRNIGARLGGHRRIAHSCPAGLLEHRQDGGHDAVSGPRPLGSLPMELCGGDAK
jgi:hypothetical protein